MPKSKRKSKPRNVVQVVPKKKVKKTREVVHFAKQRKRKEQRRASEKTKMYKCISKSFHPKIFVRERENEHGAKDDIREVVECVEINFSFSDHIERRNDTPRVLHANYSFCTTDVSIANKYSVGQEYPELPK